MASKRVNLKTILADADLRRKLMVSTIQATQAREGIETTPEQADRAYHVVTEAERGTFLDLSRYRGRGSFAEQREQAFVGVLRGESERVRFDVPLRDFSVIESSPLAFMPIQILYPLFRDHPSLFPKFAETRIGHQTFDDDRFVRSWWEVEDHQRGADHKWPPFAKGGRFSRFYSDVGLVVRWDAEAHREYNKRHSNFNVLLTSSSDEYLYRPGLTWPYAASVFNVRRMPEGCVFSHKGPAIFPEHAEQLAFISAILNSTLALFVCRALSSRVDSGGRWEAGIVRRVPIPITPKPRADSIGAIGESIEVAKHSWDRGNEIATSFQRPWILDEQVAGAGSVTMRLDSLEKAEATEGSRVERLYASLNDDVFGLYQITDATRKVIEESLGELEPEVLWQQLAGKTVEQKRMEHVWRLLSFAVKRVLETDDDGIVPFSQATGEKPLVDRVRQEVVAFFPGRDESQLELEIVNELRRGAKGYRKCASLDDWLGNVFFEYHASLYKSRPIFWHIASSQGTASFAFGALVHYHRFDKNRMAKLRASYVRDTIEELRREAGLADKAGRAEDRVELQAKVEEVQALDKKLQLIQEGHHEGPEGGAQDFRILTSWKAPDARPKSWNPDLDDGVKVNIAPLDRAGVLRVSGVAG